MIATDDFRKAIEQLSEYETNPINRFRCRRALRNERVFQRWQIRVEQRIAETAPALYATFGQPLQFDFQSLLDWLMENWDEILRILITLLPFIL